MNSLALRVGASVGHWTYDWQVAGSNPSQSAFRNVEINVAWAKVLLGHGTQLSYSSGNDFVKRNVFNCLLKEKREVAVVTLVGRLFHAQAAITRKHLSPMVRSRVLGTIRRRWERDRSRCSDSASSVQWKSRLRYEGAMLWRQRKTCTASRNLMRSGIRSQCRSRSRCETWSYFHALKTSRAAAFSTECRRSVRCRWMPASVAQP